MGETLDEIIAGQIDQTLNRIMGARMGEINRTLDLLSRGIAEISMGVRETEHRITSMSDRLSALESGPPLWGRPSIPRTMYAPPDGINALSQPDKWAPAHPFRR